MTSDVGRVGLLIAACAQLSGEAAGPGGAGTRARAAGGPQWLELHDERLQVCGLPWFGQGNDDLWRLPRSKADLLPERVRTLMRMTAGVRIRFRSDTRSLKVQATAKSLTSMPHMSAIGTRGLDVYVDGAYWASNLVHEVGGNELALFHGVPSGMKDITIYLPAFQALRSVRIGVDGACRIESPAPHSRASPVVFYGSSIAQGACASRPGMSYEAILARAMDLNFVNLGFSGAGKAEPAVVNLVAQVDACCYVLDLGKSFGMQSADVYGRMLSTLRAAHPRTPIICITPIYSTREAFSIQYKELSQHVRQVVTAAVEDRIEHGDRRLYLVDGLLLLGPDDADGFQEGTHPSDLGFWRIAERLRPTLKAALQRTPSSQADDG